MKKIVLLSLAFCFANASYSQTSKEVSIKGTVSNLPRNITKAYLIELNKEQVPMDSAIIDDKGNFTFKTAKVKSPNFYSVQFEPKKSVVLILSPGEKVVFSSDATDLMNKMNIKGSVESELVFSTQSMVSKFEKKLDSLENVYETQKTSPKADSIYASLIKQYESIEKEKNDKISEFVKLHKQNLSSLFFIEKMNFDDNFTLLQEVDALLFAKYPTVIFVEELHKKVQSAAKLAIGAVAPEITLADPDGNLISLSSLRGKYVLIDFWASWCSPCRKENPNVVKLYADFKDKGFEIIGVSLDRSKDAWVNAIKADNLTWKHISDLKYWQSVAAKEYGVEGIPFTVLLDKEGKIIAKSLRGEALRMKLEELLGK
ncbi:MAG: TlpA disulfide reductase family protein [Bacteroidota bacterium]